MINIFKKIVSLILAGAVKILLFRKKPEIIAVTGSAGKTTTKQFIKEILEIDFDVLASEEGYNTELGAPLVLFNLKAPLKTISFLSWLSIIFKVYFRALTIKDFPDKIVVEMGADKPGDIKYLTKLFPPKVAVVLTVLPSHLLEFKTIEGVAHEKANLVKAVKKGGRVFLNADDDLVKEMKKSTNTTVVTFGTKEADLQATDITADLTGLKFSLMLNGKVYHFVSCLYGKQMLYPLLAAIAVARAENINIEKIKEKVKELKPFKGRMNVIEGIKESVIIDDSYNANPNAVIKALEFLKDQKGRKIALLGTMNELGDFEEEGHRKVGAKAADSANILVTVGKPAQKYLADESKKKGLEKIYSFDNSVQAGEWLKENIKEGDIILAKGSQNNVRIERAVEQIMKNPAEKEMILVRQGEEWKNRP